MLAIIVWLLLGHAASMSVKEYLETDIDLGIYLVMLIMGPLAFIFLAILYAEDEGIFSKMESWVHRNITFLKYKE